MKGPIFRITLGHLIVAVFWDEELRQADIYDTHNGAQRKDQYDHVDALTSGSDDILDLVGRIVNYGETLGLTIDDINYGS